MRQDEKEKKHFSPEFRSYWTRGRKFRKKNSKKIQKIEKPLSGILFSQNGMRYAEKARKKFQSRIPFLLDPGMKISKKIEKKNQKIEKPLFGIIFSQNGMRQAEKDKKKKKIQSGIPFILDPGKKIPKKKYHKNQKIEKPLSGNIFSQNGMRQADKEAKNFQSRVSLILDPGNKISRKIVKKFKKLKNLFPAFL